MLAYLPIIFGITASLTHNILIDYFKIVILHEFTIATLRVMFVAKTFELYMIFYGI